MICSVREEGGGFPAFPPGSSTTDVSSFPRAPPNFHWGGCLKAPGWQGLRLLREWPRPLPGPVQRPVLVKSGSLLRLISIEEPFAEGVPAECSPVPGDIPPCLFPHVFPFYLHLPFFLGTAGQRQVGDLIRPDPVRQPAVPDQVIRLNAGMVHSCSQVNGPWFLLS